MTSIVYLREDQIGIIEMNRPPANSYEVDFMRNMNEAITAAEQDSHAKIVVVRSALAGFFCGGADIKQFQGNTAAANIELIALAHEALARPSQSNKVYIAEVNGHALGGGLEIALACDLRFAGTGRYWLGLPEVTLGLLPGNGGTQRLASLVGPSKALELMILGTRLGPEEAHRMGIVSRLFEPQSLRRETMTFAQTLAKSATFAIGQIKRAIYDGFCVSMSTGLAVERANIAKLFRSNDAKEGFAAFVERRQPAFSGN